MGKLAGQHIFVTGGTRGIGAAVVDKCLAEDARVTFMDLEGEGRTDALFVQAMCAKPVISPARTMKARQNLDR